MRLLLLLLLLLLRGIACRQRAGQGGEGTQGGEARAS